MRRTKSRWLQETYRHYGNQECRAYIAERSGCEERIVHNSERAGAWMQVVGGRAAVTGTLRNFLAAISQGVERQEESAHAPSLESAAGTTARLRRRRTRSVLRPGRQEVSLRLESGRRQYADLRLLLPRRPTCLEARRRRRAAAINKHHEVWYHFGRTSEAAAGREYGALADKQPLALATGKWNVETEVFGPLAARPHESSYEAIVDRIFDLERKAQDDFGDYGWFLFGAGPH